MMWGMGSKFYERGGGEVILHVVVVREGARVGVTGANGVAGQGGFYKGELEKIG